MGSGGRLVRSVAGDSVQIRWIGGCVGRKGRGRGGVVSTWRGVVVVLRADAVRFKVDFDVFFLFPFLGLPGSLFSFLLLSKNNKKSCKVFRSGDRLITTQAG